MVAREITSDGGMRVLPPYPVVASAQLGFILTSGGVAIGAGAVADAGAIFRVATSTGTNTWLWSDGGIGTPGQIVLGVDDHVFFGESGSKLHRIAIGTSSPTSIPTAGPIVAAPVIGADGGIVYAVTTNGFVHAVNAITMEPLWTMPRPPGNPVFDTSPTIDCARKAGETTGGPGTLYVMGRATGSLYALIVDSRGLDHRAPWPKFQNDVRNSGFPDGVATPICP